MAALGTTCACRQPQPLGRLRAARDTYSAVRSQALGGAHLDVVRPAAGLPLPAGGYELDAVAHRRFIPDGFATFCARDGRRALRAPPIRPESTGSRG
jgi:hypothetical protein